MDQEANKDASEMHDLLRSYLGNLNWSQQVTKDDIVGALAEQNDALATMVNEYLAEGTYYSLHEVMTLLPAQAWQAVQGDEWRGTENQLVEETPTNFGEGAVGEAEGAQ